MGFKDWLAQNVLGPEGYGDAMGRQARDGGSALANAVFLSHGTRPGAGAEMIFDTLSEMEAAGFKPRYDGASGLDLASLTLEEQRVFKSLTRALIAYAFLVNSNGALQNMRRDNTSKFRNGLGPSLLQSTVQCGLFGDIESARGDLLSWIRLFESSSISSILNVDKPASGDLLEYFIVKSVELAEPVNAYGAVRAGLTGFDAVAVPLVEETLKSIVAATQHFGW